MPSGRGSSNYQQVEDAGALEVDGACSVQSDTRTDQLPKAAWLALWGTSLVVTSLVTAYLMRPQASAAAAEPLAANLRAAVSLADSTTKMPSFYDNYKANFRTARYIDLTHAFSPQGPVWPGFGTDEVHASKAGITMKGYVDKGDTFTYLDHGFIATAYHLKTDQYGTQLDPPSHWNEYGATISDLPASFTLRPLVVVDISEKVKKDPGYHATVADVEEWEKKYQTVPPESAVFFRSDWSKSWTSFQKSGGVPSTYPGVKLETLKFLHLKRNILFHGHEPLDTDMTATLEGEAWLMHNNFAQAEGLMNLDLVPEYGCLLSIGFAKPLGGTGGYARYIAVCPESSTDNGVSVASSPGAPLKQQDHPLRRGEDGVLKPDPGATPTEYCSVKGALGCDGKKNVWST